LAFFDHCPCEYINQTVAEYRERRGLVKGRPAENAGRLAVSHRMDTVQNVLGGGEEAKRGRGRERER